MQGPNRRFTAAENLVVGTNMKTPARGININCTVAGNVVINIGTSSKVGEFYPMTIRCEVGTTILEDYSVIGVASATATATYQALS